MKTAAQRALYNNLGKVERLALAVDAAIMGSRQDGWKTNTMKTKKVRNAIGAALKFYETTPPTEGDQIRESRPPADYQREALTDRILELTKHQNDY